MTAALLALGAAALWGVANFQAGLLSRAYSVLTVLVVSRGVSLVACAVLIVALGVEVPTFENFIIAALAGILVTAGLAAFYRGLAVGTMSIVAPISATGAAIPVIFGLGFGDQPSELQLFGIAFAISGAVLAGREQDHPQKSAKMLGVFLAVIAALSFGIFFVMIDVASEGGSILWLILATRLFSLPIVAAVARSRQVDLIAPRSHLHKNVSIGLMEMAALIMFAEATTRGLLSLVGVLGSLYPVVTVMLASTFLHERISRYQWVGVVGALTGVVFITVG